ncbi:MAG: glycosyltransferase family 1 protein [Hyphomicrobiales bacterium]|nr:glycosyltransferase family 1 protein [Hyphomicrobiales bacterium]MBV8663230.1 glycosyltransferase family 1 protein [Hyphomicrobiales bacterium]
MARIVHASNFSRKAKGAFQHSIEHKITNGLIRNGHAVATFSDRDVARAGTLLGHRAFGGSAANRAFREFCRSVEPELILLGHANTLTAATIADLRSDLPGVRVLQYNVDPLFETQNVAAILSKIDVVDATLITTAGEALRPFYRRGKFLGYMPNPVDFSIERGRNHERLDLTYDLFYACGNENDPRFLCGGEWTSTQLIAHIAREAPALNILAAGVNGQPKLAGGAYQRALESAAIGLNVSKRNDIYLYSSDRIAQLVGNGLATVIDRATGYEEFLAEGEFVYFSTASELMEKLTRLAGEPAYRQNVAAAGRARYHALFNETIVAKYIVDVAFGEFSDKAYPWPTEHFF